MMKRILCLLLTLLLVCAVGCGEVAENNSSTVQSGTDAPVIQTNVMQLLYCLSDSFDPYSAQTAVNRELCGLIYDPLVSLDDTFEPIYALASSVKTEGKTCTVTLKDALFTDGSAVTADDVVYSYNLARASATAYAAQLYEVASVKASGGKTVVFALTRVDPLFENLLDFPILKAGSDKVTDADGVVQPPVGCGRYKLNETKDTLLRNDGYYGIKGSVDKIKLINAPDKESVSHYVEIGATDIYFTDVSDGNIVRMSGKKRDINLNDLVYIGINEANDALRSPYMRYAISSALDRDAICRTAYFNNATAASGFFHPEFGATNSLQNLKNTNDLKIAIENLEKIGYNSLNSNGYRIDSAGRYPSFTLLVNSDNVSRTAAAELIAAQLKEAGIELKVVKKPYAQYIEMLKSGSFQLYLGEIRITANMDLSPLLVDGGSAAYGRTPKTEEKAEGGDATNEPTEEQQAVPATAAEIITGYYEGRYTIADVASVLLTELPAIPVCYKRGLLFYDPSSVDLTQASAKDIYYSNETGKRVGS